MYRMKYYFRGYFPFYIYFMDFTPYYLIVIYIFTLLL